ncbi:MAG: hypothetical protein ACPG6P_12600 [Akkermansiaceae bacterium]
MNTKKERFLGLFREVLTAGGALAFGAFDGLPSIIGLIVSISSVIWAWTHHEGSQIIATSIRKTLSMIPGVLLALGWVRPDTAGLLASFLAPLFALVWSFLDKDGVVKVPKGSGAALFALSASLALLFASCAEVIPSYQVTNSGENWPTGETRNVPAKDVKPNVRLPDELGGAIIPIPQIDPQK